MGANGKSTIIDLFLDLMGEDYASKAPTDLLMVKRGQSHPTEQADLQRDGCEQWERLLDFAAEIKLFISESNGKLTRKVRS